MKAKYIIRQWEDRWHVVETREWVSVSRWFRKQDAEQALRALTQSPRITCGHGPAGGYFNHQQAPIAS